MKITMAYDPSKRLVKRRDKEDLNFFCGDELDEIAITILDLDSGNITPQEAYIIFLKMSWEATCLINSAK